MVATEIHVEKATPGFNYTVETGMEPFYDEDGNRALDTPTEIIGGWAPSEDEAKRHAQKVAENLDK